MVSWEPVWLITLSMFYYTYGGGIVYSGFCVSRILFFIFMQLLSTYGQWRKFHSSSFHPHWRFNVKCSTGVQEKKRKKEKKTILMRYAEQLSSNKTSNSLPSSNSMASQASEMLQNLGWLFLCISGSSIFVISRNVCVKKSI